MHTLMHLQQFQPWPIIETPETVGPIHFSLFCCRLERVGGGWRWQWERCADCCLHLAASVCSRCCLAAIAVTLGSIDRADERDSTLSASASASASLLPHQSHRSSHTTPSTRAQSLATTSVHLTPLCTRTSTNRAADHVVAAAALPLAVARAQQR